MLSVAGHPGGKKGKKEKSGLLSRMQKKVAVAGSG